MIASTRPAVHFDDAMSFTLRSPRQRGSSLTDCPSGRTAQYTSTRRGVGTGEAGSAAAPPTSEALEQCSLVNIKIWS